MKLLQPRQVNDQLQKQNSEQAKAGLFLARKVDTLREELQDVQKLHDDSIAGMKKEYELFSSEQNAKRGNLIKEITDLTAEREKLLIPLDAEWKKVNELTQKNQEKSEFLEGLGNNLSERERIVGQSEKEVKIAADSAKDTLSEAEKIKEKAQKIYLVAENKLKEAQIYETEIKQDLKIRTETVTKRETDIAYREVDVENRLKNALAKEEANRKETLRIESKQRQLKVAMDIYGNIRNTNTSK